MANAYTATALLASLKRRGLLPSTSTAFSASDYLSIIDEEIQTYIVPLLMQVREEYLVTYKDYTLSSTNSYYIPERAVLGGLRDVALVSGSTVQTLSRFEPDNITDFTQSIGGATGFYVQGNSLVLVPPQTSGTLRMSYFRRPNRLVATAAVGEVTLIASNVVTVSTTVPSTFTTSATFDFVKGKPGFDTLGMDYSASAVGSTTVTFSSTPPSDLAVGDFVCLSQESPIPQIPVELHPLLAQRVTATVLAALGDDKSDRAFKVADEMEARARMLLAPRVQGANRFVINRHGVGMGSRYRRGF